MGTDASPWNSAWELQREKRYRSGLLALDALIPEGILPGSMILLQGDLDRKLLRHVVTQLSIGLLTTNDSAELAFVDGANLFPYYEIATEARRQGYDPLVILDRIQLSRAFNFHQMSEILTKRLPKLLEVKNHLKTILVPQISSQYLSTEALEYLEYAKLSVAEGALSELTQAVGTLKSLALRHNLVVIMTAASATGSKTRGLGGTYLTHSASSVIRMATSAHSTVKEYDIHFVLQKDPSRPVMQLNHSHRRKKPVNDQMLINRYW
ncbi:MAG: hypothetical protein ACW97Z_15700 [Candidatus Hodarchaeales archaeon]|jgi:hypothetical protein